MKSTRLTAFIRPLSNIIRRRNKAAPIRKVKSILMIVSFLLGSLIFGMVFFFRINVEVR